MAALRIWWLPVLMGIGQLLAWPVGPVLVGSPPAPLDAAVTVVVTIVVAIALGWRRRAPVGALAMVALALMAGTIVLPYDALSVIAFGDLVVLFSLAMLRPARVTVAAVTLLSISWISVVTAVGIPDLQVSVAVVLPVYIMVAAFGRSRGRWARARAAAAARLEAAEAEQRRAAEVELERLARELHDVTAHHLTAIVVHAGAARRLGADRPELVAQALEFAADTGRRTLTALNRLVTVIEPAAEPLAPRLTRLAAAARAAGQEVAFEVTGPAETLPPPISDAVFAVVQEALTNAMRYAAGAAVTARVVVTGGEALVTVDNRPARVAGEAAGGPGGRLGSGRGLAGLAARAKDLAGTFEAGPCPAGGWRVHAGLPLVTDAGPARSWLSSERVLDAAVTVCVLLPAMLVLLAAIDAGEIPDKRSIVLIALLLLAHGAPVWWRRVAPWRALISVLVGALAFAAVVAGTEVPSEAAVLLVAGLTAEVAAVWAVASHARPHVTAWAGTLAAGGVWALVWLLVDDSFYEEGVRAAQFAVLMLVLTLAFAAVLAVLVWGPATLLRRRRERTLATEEAALQAATERAAAAAHDQRARFAAGLHASVLEPAHRLVAAAEAGPAGGGRPAAEAGLAGAEAGLAADVALAGGGVAGSAAGAGLAAIDRVTAEARAGLAAMRELLGALQPVPAGDRSAPPRGIADLTELCAELRAAGRAVTLNSTPAPYPLPVAVDLSGYRIVDAALDTDDAGDVSVSVAYPGDSLSVTVTGVPSATSGIVAARIRARVAALGGRVRLHPAGVVEVSLPAAQDEGMLELPVAEEFEVGGPGGAGGAGAGGAGGAGAGGAGAGGAGGAGGAAAREEVPASTSA